MNILTALVAIPAYFDMRRFAWLMRSPELPKNYERIIRRLVANEDP